MIVVDAANVIGSRPTGWWRDRAGAARRFAEQVRGAVRSGALDAPVTVVLEGQARAGAPESDGAGDGVSVVHASGEGDDTIVEVAAGAGAGGGSGGGAGTLVVTADRELGARVRAAGAEVVGPGWLLDRLGA